jgi:HEPN domain-containing protein
LKLSVLAQDLYRRAVMRIKSAELAHTEASYPDVVRYSQESVELSLKAALRAVGVEYPKQHDVSRILRSVRDRFPEWLRGEVDRLGEISRDLADKRSPSLYGIESLGKTASDIFGREEAERALSDAKHVLNTVNRLLTELGVV